MSQLKTIKEYCRLSGLSRPTIMTRIRSKRIEAVLGCNKNGVPCWVINANVYPPKGQERGKPGRKKGY